MTRGSRPWAARQLAALLLVATLAGWQQAPHSLASPAPAPGVGCRGGDPLAHVQRRANKLRLLAPCVSATGLVVAVFAQPDGDVHVQLLPDAASRRLLNRANYLGAFGTLVCEVIPYDRPHVRLPRSGQMVRVTGAYVLDRNHGWREIHPVWRIAVLGAAGLAGPRGAAIHWGSGD